LICVDELNLDALRTTKSFGGRKSTPQTIASSGHYCRALPFEEKEKLTNIAMDATMRAALLRNNLKTGQREPSLTRDDLRKKIYLRPQRTLIIFLVDSSDSMGEGTYARIKTAKGAVLAILAKAYQKRHRVGLVTFREESAEILLQPTSSLALAQQKLKALPTGGATPFAHGLMKAWRLIKTERLKYKGIRPLLVILSDGEANVPYASGRKTSEITAELFAIAEQIGRDNITTITIDSESLPKRSNTMNKIAELSFGVYHHISRLKIDGMVRLVADF